MSVVIPSLRAAVAVPGWAKNELWRKARAVPSLDLRFAENKSLVDATTGSSLVTFTRASSGTFVDSAGVLQTAVTDAPRFDHNPTTGESLGLLVEEQRTNLLLRSEEFDDAFWTKTNATITTDNIASPAGPVTADKLVETSATGVHRIFNNTLSILASTTYTLSVYAKAGERSRLQLDLRDSIGIISAATFNLVNGTFTSNIGTAHTITALQNGWYRLAVSATTSVSHASAGTFVFAMGDGTSTSYTGDGTSGIYLWGAQLEAGAFPTSYIPTTTATVTRSADVCSISGSNFDGWYRQDEGTVFVDAASIYNGGRYVMFDDGTTVDRWELRYSSFLAVLNSWKSSVQEASANSNETGGAPSTNVKVAGANKTNDIAIASNGAGALLGVDTTSTMPANQTRMFIGSFQGTATYTNGAIRRLTYWPQRLPNSTLQAVTQ